MLGLKEPMNGRKLSEVFLLGPNVPHHGNRIPKSQGSRNPHSINREAVQGHRQAGAEPELKAKVLGPSPTRFHNPEDEMIGWYHRLNGHEFEKALGVGDGQGSLACCSPWGHKESDMTE